MVTQKVKSLGFELTMLVPGTVDEYNGLAPKRTNAALEDAIASTVYRNVLNKLRDKALDALEKHTGVARINHGTEDDPQWEKEGVYFKRLIATVAQQRGIDPAAEATKTTLIAEWTPIVQGILDTIKFDPSERESTGGGSNLVAKKYIAWAKEAVQKGNHVRMAQLLAKALNRPVDLVGDTDKGDESADVKTLARAISDREAAKRAEQDRAAKAELGLE